MTDGLQVPTIPFGEVVFKVGGVSPLHKVKVVIKFGITLVEIVIKTVSVISRPQLFVAVKVINIVPLALEGIV